MLVATCTNIWNLLKQEKVKVKQIHYPAIGLLALLEDGEKEIHSVKALIEKLQGRNCSVGIQIRVFLLLFNCS